MDFSGCYTCNYIFSSSEQLAKHINSVRTEKRVCNWGTEKCWDHIKAFSRHCNNEI